MTTETAGRPVSVTDLHKRWRGTLDRLNPIPGCLNPRREARLIEAGRLEKEIGKTPDPQRR